MKRPNILLSIPGNVKAAFFLPAAICFCAHAQAQTTKPATKAATPAATASVLSTGSEPALHLSYTFFDDSFYRAAPTCMKHAHGAAFDVDENDGQAIRCLNAEQQAGSSGDQAVAS